MGDPGRRGGVRWSDRMPTPELEGALTTLTEAVAARPALYGALHARWRRAGAGPAAALEGEVRSAADRLDESLPALTQSEEGRASLTKLFGKPAGEIVPGKLDRCRADGSGAGCGIKRVDQIHPIETLRVGDVELEATAMIDGGGPLAQGSRAVIFLDGFQQATRDVNAFDPRSEVPRISRGDDGFLFALGDGKFDANAPQRAERRFPVNDVEDQIDFSGIRHSQIQPRLYSSPGIKPHTVGIHDTSSKNKRSSKLNVIPLIYSSAHFRARLTPFARYSGISLTKMFQRKCSIHFLCCLAHGSRRRLQQTSATR